MDKITLKKLQQLVKSEYWDAIPIFVDIVVEKWNNEPVKNDTEWLTLWAVAEKQGKIEGLKEFINSCEKLTHEN